MVRHRSPNQLLSDSSATNYSVYSQLFTRTKDLVLVLSSDSRIEYANPSAEKFFKLPKPAYLTRPINDYLNGEVLLKITETLKKVNEDHSQYRIEIDAAAKNHNLATLELTILPRVNGEVVDGFLLNFRDVSQERQVQDLIREAQKMEALQYFVSGTTKEIQHPLLAILKKMEGFEKKYDGRSFEYVSYKEYNQIISFLKMLHAQIKSCYETAAKLTNLNKKHLKFESHYCSATDVIREIVKLKEANLDDSTMNFRLRLSDKLPLIALGEIELTEIVTHIIDNALQAMPAGGHLLVTSSLVAGGQDVRIDISDDGVGIDPEDLPHIFEPFFTTQQSGVQRRTGLGLSIVYSLVKAAHGQIKVDSSLRKGTTVHLTFPAAEFIPKAHHVQNAKPNQK
jgi:two-component system cell cycle sensor histidine kinase/response regulator CckA